MFYITHNNCSSKKNKCKDIDLRTNKNNLSLPIEIYTKCHDPQYPYNTYNKKIRHKQYLYIKHIYSSKCHIYKFKKAYDTDSKIPTVETKFAIIQFLKDLEYNIEELDFLDKEIKLPCIFFEIHGNSLSNDLLNIFEDEWLDKIIEKIKQNDLRKGRFYYNKRLSTVTRKHHKGKIDKHIYLDKYIQLENQNYQVAIGIHDNEALFCNKRGQENFKSPKEQYIHNTVNLKNNMYLERDEETIESLYLNNYNMHLEYNDKIAKISQKLGCKENKNLEYTIGESCQNILNNLLSKHFQLTHRELKTIASYATRQEILKNESSTATYLAKVNGGRCINNRPLDIITRGVLVDVDIKGCYSQSLQYQEYPIGEPIIIDYKIKSKHNQYMTLKTFIDQYKQELISGLWILRVSTKEKLAIEQDYFYSWFPPNNLRDLLESSITNTEEDHIEPLNDTSKIFTREITNGILQHDDLEWIDKVCSKRQREELYNKLYVITGAYYPKSKRVNTVTELQDKRLKHIGINTCKIENNEKIIKQTEENYNWTSVNLGELVINSLKNLRNLYPKDNKKTSSDNELIKQLTNSIYGSLTSPYYEFANVIVGNNITARARSMAWYMEKGLNGFQTITDGCVFDLNAVIKPHRYKLNSEKLQNIEKALKERKIIKRALLQTKKTIEELEDEEIKKTIELEIKKHLEIIFRGIEVVKQYQIEVVEVVDELITHGAANYQLLRNNKIIKTKMRSYKCKQHQLITEEGNTTNPVLKFFEELRNRNKYQERIPAFIERETLKFNEYAKNIQKYQTLKIRPGNTIERVRMLQEASLSTFTFQTSKQYKKWNEEHIKYKMMTGQSFEIAHINEAGLLDYEEMLKTMKMKIEKGDEKYKIKKIKEHPYYKEVTETTEKIKEANKNLITINFE